MFNETWKEKSKKFESLKSKYMLNVEEKEMLIELIENKIEVLRKAFFLYEEFGDTKNSVKVIIQITALEKIIDKLQF